MLYIVYYKSTSTKQEISLEDEYKQAYKRQVEVYQWIFRQLGSKVSDTAVSWRVLGVRSDRATVRRRPITRHH